MRPVKSALTGVVWPALPDARAATVLAVQFQLEHSQWWDAPLLQAHQMRQLALVVRHAYATVPFYRARADASRWQSIGDISPARWADLAFMTRREVQDAGRELVSGSVPPGHGGLVQGETSGSTGMPITYWQTELTQFFWRAFALRDHLWHQRDLTQKLAGIRPKMEDAVTRGWGPATDVAFDTGVSATLNIRADFDTQLRWLQEQAPAYLISNAHNVYGLARRSLELGIRIPGLREARTYGGVVPEDARAIVREAWGVPLTDCYTCEEVGYLALQCPGHEHFHVQSENLLVEVLNDEDRPCAAGEIGRVVVSNLHNFAMPLLRYELGDFAEVGAPCACGRGLPVLKRILGRQRNLLTLPDGRRRWPSFASVYWAHVAPIRQLQMVQKTRDLIEVRVVAARALSAEEKRKLVAALQGCLGYPFEMEVQELDEIPRHASHKFEDFVSEIAG